MPYDIDVNFSTTRSSVLTENLNFANPSTFKLVLDSLKYPNAQFNIQTAALPDLSVTGAPFNTPQRNITAMPDKIDYGAFTVAFIVDEYLTNYQEIHDWLLGLVTTVDKNNKKTRDMTLQILSSANNVIREIQFIDAYPTTLSSLPFETTSEDVNYLVATVEFNYNYFKLL